MIVGMPWTAIGEQVMTYAEFLQMDAACRIHSHYNHLYVSLTAIQTLLVRSAVVFLGFALVNLLTTQQLDISMIGTLALAVSLSI